MANVATPGTGADLIQTITPSTTPHEPHNNGSFAAEDEVASEGMTPSLKCYGDIPMVGTSSNVLLLYQLSDMRLYFWVTTVIAILTLVYIGMQLVLLAVASDWVYAMTIHATFHYAEFWSTFAFSVVDVTALLITVKGSNNMYYKPLVMKFLPAISIIMTFVPAVLMSFDMKRFGFQAHNIEYTAQIFLALIDAILWTSVLLKSGATKTTIFMFCMVIFAMLISMIQLVIWNVMMNATGRQVAHLLEFCSNIIEASTTFWFIIDTRIQFGNWIQCLSTQGGMDTIKCD